MAAEQTAIGTEVTPTPHLWSDLDGTALRKYPKYRPRNWTKRKLPLIPGYTDFLEGVQRSGIELDGIVTRRATTFVKGLAGERKRVTERSMKIHRLHDYFPSVVLTGSEAEKAEHLVAEAAKQPIGMIDDKPHKLGAEIVRILNQQSEADPVTITLGVVAQPKSDEYMGRLYRDDVLEETEIWEAGESGFIIVSGDSSLTVVQLEPFSHDAGEAFAEQMVA